MTRADTRSLMLTARGTGREDRALSIVEPVEAEQRSVERTNGAQTGGARSSGSRRRRLSPEEQREVARLYADGSLPTSQIRDRFGIGESSLYRIVQRQGVPLRGRGRPASEQADSSRPAAARPVATSQPPAAGARTGQGRMSRAAHSEIRTVPAVRNQSTQRRFRIRFRGERVVEASDLLSALRQVEALGAAEITSVTRED